MHFLDKTLDDARDRSAAPRLPRALAFAFCVIVLGVGVAYYWGKFEVPVKKGKLGKATPDAPAAAPRSPGQPPTDR